MKGIEYARLYHEQAVAPMLAERFPQLSGRVAAGLVGEGSECFGFDDEISRDHDFWPLGCLWLTREDWMQYGRRINQALLELPSSFMDLCPPAGAAWRPDRRGALSIPDFYYGFLGLYGLPETNAQWLRIPESHLAAATNGAVFEDQLGEFSKLREGLLAYYPENLRLYKIAGCCMEAAQSGQYNYLRCHRRGESVAALLSLSEFLDKAISLLYLLNRRYRPFYKWSHRGLLELPVLGPDCHGMFTLLAETPEQEYEKKIWIIEQICTLLAGELKKQGLSDSDSDFLLEHAPCVRRHITDPELLAGIPG